VHLLRNEHPEPEAEDEQSLRPALNNFSGQALNKFQGLPYRPGSLRAKLYVLAFLIFNS
jgi:hypothetical protein